jgi:hypothetical protein
MLLPFGHIKPIHESHVLFSGSHPSFDSTRQDNTLHLMVLAILNMVLEPPRRSRATPFGTSYKPWVSDAPSIDHSTSRLLLTAIPYDG